MVNRNSNVSHTELIDAIQFILSQESVDGKIIIANSVLAESANRRVCRFLMQSKGIRPILQEKTVRIFCENAYVPHSKNVKVSCLIFDEIKIRSFLALVLNEPLEVYRSNF